MRTVPTTRIFLVAVSLIAVQVAQGASSTWNLNPTSGDWNTAANWTPAIVPNAPDATAIFDISNTTNLSLSGGAVVGEIIFNPGASAFTITAPDLMSDVLSIVGTGLSNQSGIEQTLVAPKFGEFSLGLPTLIFKGNALAGDLIILTTTPRGGIRFQDNSSADRANIVGVAESVIVFSNSSNADSATITANGADQTTSYGGEVDFIFNSDAGEAILIAEGGIRDDDGGRIYFTDDSTGGLAQVRVFGNGTLLTDHAEPGVTIGSLEGDGIVSIGLGILSIGSNGRDTVFSGVIKDFTFFSPLRKVGDGSLHLRGASTYSQGTIIDGGQLLAENTVGSALGTGPVQVNSGTLGGKGIIAGQVTVGDGSSSDAFLAPGTRRRSVATLNLQSTLTFAEFSNYVWKLNTRRARADQVVAFGVSIGAGALFQARGIGHELVSPGTTFTAIENTAATPIAGQFANLADGNIITVKGNRLQADYAGGDGNDLTLTVVP